MDFNKLNVFLVVADTGSFSKAAEILGYTQAGVSYVIKTLEEELQLKLVERNFNGVKLSTHGRSLYPEFCRLSDAYKSFEASITERKRYSDGTLRIGAINTIATRWFAETLDRVRKKNPNIRYEAIIGDPFELNEWIESGKVDVAFSERAWASKDFFWKDITSDPYFAILPKGAAHDVPCKFETFENEIFYVADFGEDRNSVMNLKSRGISPRFYPDKISNSMVVKAASMGLGRSIMSAIMLCDTSLAMIGDHRFPEIVRMEDNLQRTLGFQVMESKRQNKLMRGFVDELVSIVAEDVIWNSLISSEKWTYQKELDGIDYARRYK